MDVEICQVGKGDCPTLLNMVKMYCYEWSQYNGIEIDEKGEFEFERHIGNFWTREGYYPFFIRADGKLAGFVLVDTDFDLRKDSDHAVSEFFVMYKYRRAGVGKSAARQAFAKLPGKWEIRMHPGNTTSISFWKNVVDEITQGDYEMAEACPSAKYQDGALGTIIAFNNRR